MRLRGIPKALFALPLLAVASALTPLAPGVAWADNPPVVTAPASVSGAENSAVNFTVQASDPDGDAITSLLMSPTSTGATFSRNADMTSGSFSWTPTFTQSGVFDFTFTALNALSGSATTQVTVANTDRAPVVTAPATMTGASGSLITFTVAASDPDGDAIASLTAAPLPSGASFSSNATQTSGTFSWTPGATQAGTYSVVFTATNALTRSATTVLTIFSEGDHAPLVTAPATVSGVENVLISFSVTAIDPEGDPILSFTASGTAITAGGSFTSNAANTSGTFNWLPDFTDAGSYAVTFTAANALTGSATTFINIGSDRAPVVTAPVTTSGLANSLITFTVSAVDPDGDAIVSLTAAPLPSGATFTVNAVKTSGTFSWTPTFGQGGGTYNVTFAASNVLSGSATTAITVLAGADRAPIVTAPATAVFGEGMAGSFTVSATDPDGDVIASLTAAGTAITAGASFTSNATHTSGTLSWTPGFTQLGSYSATFTAANALTGSATTAITVGQLFTPPVVTAPATVTGAEGTLISFTVTASDPDDAILSLTATPLPPGATFSTNATHTSGTFSWTPTFSQAGTYNVTFFATNSLSGSATTAITVQDVCQPPAADAGGPYAGAVNAPISLDGSGTTGSASSYQWDFGDGTTGTGITVTHIYTIAGTYTVTLTVTGSCGTSSDVTTATLGQSCAFAFTSGGNKNLRLDSGKPNWCAQVQPVPGCYSNSDVVLSSIVLRYNGGEIPANTGKSAVSGDVNKDGVEEITACFAKTDLRQLFAGLPAGENQITVSIAMDLVSGGQVTADLTIRVYSSGAALAAQVTPNPFNPSAILSFHTTRDGFARAALYDASGRRVRTLLDERMLTAGIQEVRLDGRSSTGAALPSGIYLYRVETAEGTASGRVVLLK